MPLCLFCSCGHSAPLPENSVKLVCSQCKRSIELPWFAWSDSGKTRISPFTSLALWRLRAGRVSQAVEPIRIEFVPEPQHS